jgi:hypothetical protein
MKSLVNFTLHQIITSRKIRWVGHEECIGEVRNTTWKVSLENLKVRDNLEDLGVNIRIILDWVLEK